jgi:outer membrane protein TolC
MSLNPTSKAAGNFRSLLLLTPVIGLFACLPLRGQITFAEDLFPELGSLMEQAATGGTELKLSELRLEEREGDLDVTRGAQRPQVRAYARVAGAYEVRDDIDDRFRGSVNANLTMSQPLYHWGNLDRQELIAEGRVALEEVEVNRKGARHFMDIRRAYLEWLLMNERSQILEQSIALSESFVDARRQLVGVGQSSEQDVLEMEAHLLENHESLAYVRNRARHLETTLRRLVGPSFNLEGVESQSLSIIEPMESGEFDVLARWARGGESSYTDPSIQRFSVLEEIESENLAMLDKRNWPNLDLVAGIYSDHIDGVNQEDFVFRVQYFAGFQVNWSIFDGWQTDGWKRSALARKRAFALQEEVARDETRQKTETLLGELQLNLKQIEARSKREVILNRRLGYLREQADSARITGADRIEGEIDYLEVRQRLMEARVYYLINLMELGVLLGTDPAVTYYSDES